MNLIDRIVEWHADLTAWRRDLHAHPEIAFQERRTAAFVADKLRSWDIDVHTGLAHTGVVGTLRSGEGKRAIGLRAEIDALPMQELNNFDHRSTTPGVFHGCGHDGHATMLLGAARYLAATREFDGTVHFVFQPAEENLAGGGLMVRDGLFEKFPMSAVYGMHNRPNLPFGQFGMRSGRALACADNFGIVVRGRGVHAAYPHLAADVVVAAAQIVVALQAIVSRQVPPLQPAVLSVTSIHGGTSDNVIPEEIELRGTVRALAPEVQDRIESSLHNIAQSTAAMYGASAEVRYERRYPSLFNDPQQTAFCAGVAAAIVGADRVITDHEPIMGSDDFAFMSNVVPGAFVWIGSGPTEDGRFLHNSRYDFNDRILPIGASYWARLAESALPRTTS